MPFGHEPLEPEVLLRGNHGSLEPVCEVRLCRTISYFWEVGTHITDAMLRQGLEESACRVR